MIPNTFGCHLRQLRVERDITLRDFARRLGVTPTYVSQIEQDYCKPPKAHVVEKMAHILNQDVDEFLTLAGRLPEDLCEVIRNHPASMVAFQDLQLTVGWVEMATMLPAVQSLAFLCVPHRAVLVDESLHPNEAPELRSRLRFTFAHEIGHWCLHRRELDVAMGWSRRDPTREVIREQEANRFAGALLIPATMLRESWRHAFGTRSLRRDDLLPVRSQLIREEVCRRRFRPVGEDAAENLMFEGAVSRLAADFGVSPQALRIRAEELGLIIR